MPKTIQANVFYVSGVAVSLGIGFILGKLWNALPLVRFKGDIDVGAIISLISLIVAIYVIPFVINTYFARRNHLGTILQADLDEAITKCEDVSSQFKDIHFSNKALTENDLKLLFMRFREINNLLTTISENSVSLPDFKSFKTEVLDMFTDTAYKDYTESIMKGKKISHEVFLTATKSMGIISTRIRRYRYKIRP